MYQHLFQTLRKINIMVVFAIPFAMISLWRSGFDFGVSNNVFHIPYVLGLDASKVFIEDQFYQSLKSFTSIVWPLLRLISNESNIYYVFLCLNFVSRCATFLAILYVVRNNGLKSKIELVLGLGLFAITPWLQGASDIGGHGLFIGYFTHTEVTWPFVLTALVFLQNREIVKTGAMAGISFAINAFVGIWLMIITFITILYDRHVYRIGAFTWALAAFSLFAMPVAIWIALTLKNGNAAEPFSFIEYIRAYYSGHFLIEATQLSKLYNLLILYICGFLSCGFLEQRRFWIGVQLGCLTLFVVGTPLPYLFDNKLIFNLHLLRSDGIEQFVATILIGITGIRLITGYISSRSMMLGVLIIGYMAFPSRSTIDSTFVMLALTMALVDDKLQNFAGQNQRASFLKKLLQSNHIPILLLILWFFGTVLFKGVTASLFLKFILLTLCFLAVLIDRFPKETQCKAIISGLSLILIASAVSGIRERIQNKALHHTDRLQWQEFTQWVRGSDLHGIFLVPPQIKINSSQPQKLYQPQDSFQLLARRAVWVDWKQGAAVMWSPSFHKQWMSRYKEISSLRNAEDLRDYATKNQIDYFVIIDGTGCPSSSISLKISGKYSLCQPHPE